MKVYHDLVQRVLDHGVRKTNRTGTDTISISQSIIRWIYRRLSTVNH